MKLTSALTPFVVLGLSAIVLGAQSTITNAEAYLTSHGITGQISATQATSLAYALESAYSSIGTRSQYSSAWSVMATAVPADTFESIAVSGIPYITTTAEPSWFSALPDSVKSELLLEQSQLGSVENSILSTGTSKAVAPQNTLAVGGVLAAGLVGVAALL